MSDPAIAYEDDPQWTYKDYKKWELKPGERFELIDGVAYAMSAPGTEHQQISMILSGTLFNYFEAKPVGLLRPPSMYGFFTRKTKATTPLFSPTWLLCAIPASWVKKAAVVRRI
jgi:Uma2 family endonuclease